MGKKLNTRKKLKCNALITSNCTLDYFLCCCFFLLFVNLSTVLNLVCFLQSMKAINDTYNDTYINVYYTSCWSRSLWMKHAVILFLVRTWLLCGPALHHNCIKMTVCWHIGENNQLIKTQESFKIINLNQDTSKSRSICPYIKFLSNSKREIKVLANQVYMHYWIDIHHYRKQLILDIVHIDLCKKYVMDTKPFSHYSPVTKMHFSKDLRSYHTEFEGGGGVYIIELWGSQLCWSAAYWPGYQSG